MKSADSQALVALTAPSLNRGTAFLEPLPPQLRRLRPNTRRCSATTTPGWPRSRVSDCIEAWTPAPTSRPNSCRTTCRGAPAPRRRGSSSPPQSTPTAPTRSRSWLRSRDQTDDVEPNLGCEAATNIAGRPGMASLARYGVEVCEMQEQPRASATTSDAVDEQLPRARAAAPSIEMPATDVLITGQEVVFSTAAAVAPQRQAAGHRLLASLLRLLAGSTNASHRRQYSPPHYLERARLSREIDRL